MQNQKCLVNICYIRALDKEGLASKSITEVVSYIEYLEKFHDAQVDFLNRTNQILNPELEPLKKCMNL